MLGVCRILLDFWLFVCCNSRDTTRLFHFNVVQSTEFSSENVLAIAYLIKRNSSETMLSSNVIYIFLVTAVAFVEYQITQTPSQQFNLSLFLCVLQFSMFVWWPCYTTMENIGILRARTFNERQIHFVEAHQSNQVHYICQLRNVRSFYIKSIEHSYYQSFRLKIYYIYARNLMSNIREIRSNILNRISFVCTFSIELICVWYCRCRCGLISPLFCWVFCV